MSNIANGKPVKNRVGGVFIPVKNIEKARDWYCSILGISPDSCNVAYGHLCTLPMEGAGLVLDEMPLWGGNKPGGAPTYQTPAFMFQAEDINAAYSFMKDLGVQLETEIQDGRWFAFRDPDGNLLMVC